MQENAAFFTIVIALVKIEITLLLRDALNPEAFIPSDWKGNHRGEDPLYQQVASSSAQVTVESTSSPVVVLVG